jgi:hypothetical protein
MQDSLVPPRGFSIMSTPSQLNNIMSMTFNVFGTIGNYYHFIPRELMDRAPEILTLSEAEELALEWHIGYLHGLTKVTGCSEIISGMDEIRQNVCKEF